jgi:hypothetical protein
MSIYTTSHAHQKAHDILDRARAGGFVSDRLMKRALTVTGDIPSMDDREAAHCICPIKEAHAGMDEMGDYLDAHKPGVVA